MKVTLSSFKDALASCVAVVMLGCFHWSCLPFSSETWMYVILLTIIVVDGFLTAFPTYRELPVLG